MIVPGMFVGSSFLISVCMVIVSKALLISSATVIVRAGGAIWLNPFATVLFSVCSVLSQTLFNIYTMISQFHDGTRSFIYADDLFITAQFPTFSQVKSTIEEVLGELTEYHRNNSLRANPDMTQVTAFHLRNREATRSLKVSRNEVHLENTTHPNYLGVTLYRQDIEQQTAHTEHQDEGSYP